MNTIGRYQLVEKLGQGGMGVVYRAFDPLLQRVVAVKLIANLEAGEEIRERFFREARAAGQLSHKNIITIHDLGDHEGQPFLAMEYLEGQDLQHRMAAHIPMSLSRKLDLAIEVCEAVEYAHDHGVIHRDIKPANIFITTAGTAKILDFGLARLITSELTNSNMMMGTLNYMAPEQVRGERADHRSDIFSTGVVLYEVFGGRRAFEGDSFGATLYKILEEVPTPLRELDATLPPEIDAIVERSLVKSREERYSHMTDMLRDLQGYRQQLIVTNSPPYGGTRTDVVRTPSDAPRPLTPSPRSGSGVGSGVQPSAADAPTVAGVPTPFPPPPASTSAPLPALDSQPGTPPRSPRNLIVSAAVAVVVVVGGFTYWAFNRDTALQPAAVPGPTAPSAATQQEIATRLEQASRALQTGDRAAAQRHADAVLAISPGHAEAQKLRDQAQQAIEAANRGVTNARDLLEAGRFDDASRAAGEVLAVDPTNAEARRVMDEAGTRSKGKGADEARTRMTGARNAAMGASAQKLAAAPFSVAVAAEREAASLLKRGRLAEATAKYYEASGLFRSAEVAAQTEAAARIARAQAEQKKAEQKQTGAGGADLPAPASTEPKPAPPPTLPPVPTSTGLPSAPVAAPVAPPTPPAAPRPTPAEPNAPAVSPSAGIPELLERYESALETRNLDAMKRIWPTLSSTQEAAFRRDFQNARRIDVEIVSPQISVNGNTATAQFTRRYRLETTDGQRVGSESRTTMTLQRVGQTWTIIRIQFVLTK
ncbi:MAG TPA: protein kinase [Vicinamibacterales bacterium]|nr:protein kinase [Vicinamibacterales bacterium]